MGMINPVVLPPFSLAPTSPGYDQPAKDQTLEVRTAELRHVIRTRSPTLLSRFVQRGLVSNVPDLNHNLIQKPLASCKLKIDSKRSIVIGRPTKRLYQRAKNLHKSDEGLDLGWLLRSWSRCRWLQCAGVELGPWTQALVCSRAPSMDGAAVTLGSGSGSTSSIVAVEVLYTRLAIVSAKIWGVSNDSMWILQTFDPSRSRSSLVACNGPLRPDWTRSDRSLSSSAPSACSRRPEWALTMSAARSASHLNLAREPCISCQSWWPRWSRCRFGVLHLCKGNTRNDLRLPLQVALIQVLRPNCPTGSRRLQQSLPTSLHR